MTHVSAGNRNRDQTRELLVEVAARLLSEEGRGGVTTRAVAQAAGVQAPTIYRLFGDKDGLLDAVAQHVASTFVDEVAAGTGTGGPIEELRLGWDTHVGFGLANPDLFALLTSSSGESRSPAAAVGMAGLRKRVHAVAQAGLLGVSEPRAVDMVYAAGVGAVLALLSVPAQERDPQLADALRETVFRAIRTDAPAPPDDGLRSAVVTFRTHVPSLRSLSESERALLGEWLDREIGS